MKTCSNPFCPYDNPQTYDRFWKKPSNKDGYMGLCITCYKDQQRKNKFKKKFKNSDNYTRRKMLEPLNPYQSGEWLIILYSEGYNIKELSDSFDCSDTDIIHYLEQLDIYNKPFKQCYGCKQWKNLDNFWFRDKSTGDRVSRCIDCLTNSNIYLKNKHSDEDDLLQKGLKKCSNKDCTNPIQSINNFAKDNSKRNGYCNWCDSCRLKYRDKNRDKLNEYARNYCKENREARYAYFNNVYRPQNLEHLKFKRKEWGLKNPHKCRQYNLNRSERLQHATPTWANMEKIRNIYLERDKLTKETGIGYHVDHIIPLQSPMVCGLHIETNLQIIPAQENLEKSNKVENSK